MMDWVNELKKNGWTVLLMKCPAYLACYLSHGVNRRFSSRFFYNWFVNVYNFVIGSLINMGECLSFSTKFS
jgi:hypothetical protein